jgi:hypothetical protein
MYLYLMALCAFFYISPTRDIDISYYPQIRYYFSSVLVCNLLLTKVFFQDKTWVCE